MLEREKKCYKKDLFGSPEFDEDQIQNLTATAKLKVSVSNHCSPKFLAAFLQVPLEKELLLLLCLLYCLAPGRSNKKLNTFPLSLQLNYCFWYAKYRTCHRNEEQIVYMWIRIESLSRFIVQFTDKSAKICMLNLNRMHLDLTQTGLDRQTNTSQVQCLKPTPILGCHNLSKHHP